MTRNGKRGPDIVEHTLDYVKRSVPDVGSFLKINANLTFTIMMKIEKTTTN